MTDDLAARVAATDPGALLPARRAEEAARVEGPLTLVASAPLWDRLVYLVVRDRRGVSYGVPAVDDGGSVRRAVPGDGAASVLTTLRAADAPPPWSVTAFGDVAADGVARDDEHSIDVDQTNELVIVGDRVVKWMLHPVTGEQPGPRRLAALESAGFPGVPRTRGLVHVVVDGEPMLVAIVTDLVVGGQDGWDWAVDDVRALAREGRGADWPMQLGRLVAQMHVALAAAGTSRASDEDALRWLADARSDARAADLDPAVVDDVDRWLALLGSASGTSVMDVHGDLHIGQVMRAGEPPQYLVIDFDGNPTQELSDRLRQQPAARDVAGMLASLDHVGRVVLHRTADLTDEQRERVRRWMEEAQHDFLAGYRDALGAAGQSGLLDDRLLLPMQVQQECREYAYATRYLPHWRYVPDAALPDLLARADGHETDIIEGTSAP